MLECADSKRLWAACLNAANRYRGAINNQFSLIGDRDLGFIELERELRIARRHFGLAKIAVINHHRVHRCGDDRTLSAT